jgi:1,6-anhydro-N-acetylmuramate kinase
MNKNIITKTLPIMPEKERTELAVDLGRAVAEMRNHINYLLQEKITQHAPHISFEMVEILACLWKEDGVNQQQLAALTVKGQVQYHAPGGKAGKGIAGFPDR